MSSWSMIQSASQYCTNCAHRSTITTTSTSQTTLDILVLIRCLGGGERQPCSTCLPCLPQQHLGKCVSVVNTFWQALNTSGAFNGRCPAEILRCAGAAPVRPQNFWRRHRILGQCPFSTWNLWRGPTTCSGCSFAFAICRCVGIMV